MANLFHKSAAKTISKYVKKVLVEQAKLQRKQQQQLREYSAELST